MEAFLIGNQPDPEGIDLNQLPGSFNLVALRLPGAWLAKGEP
jgi:hypothetical protein